MGSEPTIFLLACLVSLGLTALIREIAPRIGLTDDPDGHRKLHGRATPLGGGVAIYLTTAVILGTLWLLPSETSVSDGALAPTVASGRSPDGSPQAAPSPKDHPGESAPSDDADAAAAPRADAKTSYPPPRPRDMATKLQLGYRELPALLLAGLVIVLVGLLDDWKGLKGRLKLVGQIVAASILICGGLVIRRIDIFDCVIPFDVPSYSTTLFGQEIFFAQSTP